MGREKKPQYIQTKRLLSTAIVGHPRILSYLRGSAKTAARTPFVADMEGVLSASSAPYVGLLSAHLAH